VYPCVPVLVEVAAVDQAAVRDEYRSCDLGKGHVHMGVGQAVTSEVFASGDGQAEGPAGLDLGQGLVNHRGLPGRVG
jgi:hypothetical protein